MRPLVVALLLVALGAVPQSPAMPSGPLAFGGFTGQFRADGTFSISGQGWPAMAGKWKADGARVELVLALPQRDCPDPARYDFSVKGTRVTFTVVADECVPRRMILNGSTWRPAGEREVVPTRALVRTGSSRPSALPQAAPARGSWPSFRGTQALGIADGQNLPDHWDLKTGEDILWKTAIPGLAHSSPIVWGDRVFVTSAISQDPKATFKPGLYGDGDASEDRSTQRWTIYAVDRTSGRIEWQRVAYEGVPHNKRHMKSTYASATPATDGRTVVAWFGSEGIYAYDVNGTFRWKV